MNEATTLEVVASSVRSIHMVDVRKVADRRQGKRPHWVRDGGWMALVPELGQLGDTLRDLLPRHLVGQAVRLSAGRS